MKYNPALDGLRALGMIAVVVYHCPSRRPYLPGGFIGVDLFFVLSGALITRLLLEEEEMTRRLALGRFWWRRLRRLYPAMITMILATVIASIFVFPRDILPTTLHDAAFSSAYLGTFLSIGGRVRFFGHVWSLSLEEAFYLMWPIALVVLKRPRERFLFLLLVVLASEARRLDLWFHHLAPAQRIWVALDTRFSPIALGCIVGMLTHKTSFLDGKAKLVALLLRIAAPLAAIGLLILATVADRRMTWYVVLGYPAVAVLSAVVVAHALVSVPRVLSAPPVVWLGKLSYSLYLWHVPVITFGDELGWPIPLSLSVALALSCASYFLVERPLRHKARRLAEPEALAMRDQRAA